MTVKGDLMDEKTDFEKLIESVHQLADIVRTYYELLIEKGFTAEEALKLTVEYQNAIISTARKQ